MSLVNLIVRNFRCFEYADFTLDSKATLISGPNASGKTSLLEAIHVLSSGRSFRTNRREILVRAQQSRFEVAGKICSQTREIAASAIGGREFVQSRIAGTETKGFTSLAALLPVRIIDPEVHRLLEGGPTERRQFIDWGVFHVEPGFIIAWRRYQRSLKQRNAALKAKLSRSIVTSWDEELIAAGDLIANFREQYIQDLRSYIAAVATQLLGYEIAISLSRGWPKETILSQALKDSYERDQRYGVTTVGPHRADMTIEIDQLAARERISRGQQKLLAATLLIAQVMYWIATHDEKVCLLIDDPAAELDVDNFRRFFETVMKIDCQLIVTAIEIDSVYRDFFARQFHVEQGTVRPVL